MNERDTAPLSRKDRLIGYAATALIVAMMLGAAAILVYGMTLSGPDDRDHVVRDADLDRQDAEWEWYYRDPMTRGG